MLMSRNDFLHQESTSISIRGIPFSLYQVGFSRAFGLVNGMESVLMEKI